MLKKQGGIGGGHTSLQNLLEEIEDKENSSSNSSGKKDNIREFVEREQKELKKLQKKFEQDKQKWKDDKKELEIIRYSDPSTYKKRMAILEKVKEGIENQIDKYNERLKKVHKMQSELNSKY